MRKFVKFLWICMLVLAFPMNVYAEDIIYTVDEIGVSMSIPSDYIVFTRNLRDDDAGLKKLGITKEYVLSELKEQNAYLMITDENMYLNIGLIRTNSFFEEDFDTLSDEQIMVQAEMMKGLFEKNGFSMIREPEIYTNNAQIKFVKIYIQQEVEGTGTFDIIRCMTSHNGYIYQLTLLNRDGEIYEDNEELLDILLEGLYFNGAETELAASSASSDDAVSEAFQYTDEEGRLSFMVPGNWEEKGMLTDNGNSFLEAKFVCADNPGDLIILYGCEDAWGKMSSSQKIGRTKESVADTLETDLRDLFSEAGEENPEIFKENYGDFELYIGSGKMNVGTPGMSMPYTVAVFAENGYVYMFQFSGDKNDGHFEDFETLLSSLRKIDSEETGMLTEAESGVEKEAVNNEESLEYEAGNRQTANSQTEDSQERISQRNNQMMQMLQVALLTVVVTCMVAGIIVFVLLKNKSKRR